MDMERIKQNLRLRSGRSKKSKKTLSVAALPVVQTADSVVAEQPPSKPRPHQRTVSAVDNPDPSLRNWDKETGFQRLQLPSSITGKADSSTGLHNWDRDTALPQIEPQAVELPQSPPPELQKSSSRPSSRPSSRQATPSGLPNGPNSSRKLKPSDLRDLTRRVSTRYGASGIEIGAIAEEMVHEAAKTELKPRPVMAKSRPQQISDSDDADFDLRPPPSRPKSTSIDTLSEMLFSEAHLNILIHDPQLMTRFSGFLNRYKPALAAVVLQYLEFQKAIKAIEYANAVAANITPIPTWAQHEEGYYGSGSPSKSSSPSPTTAAAQLSPYFAETTTKAFNTLLTLALPAFITYTFVRLSTECLIAEISNHHTTPLTKNLIGGLSEVFCLSDPTTPDNPLIYCSEGFYNLTGYSAGDVLGHNCRFLQGPKTDKASVRRIRQGVERGEAVTETVLNYRRDGRGFLNVLMISPLEDDRGKVKYFLGAQVDVSRLVAGQWGLEGLDKLVQKKEMEESRRGRELRNDPPKANALDKLRELSEMFDLEESAVVQTHSRSSSRTRAESSERDSKRWSRTRRVFGDSGEVKTEEPASDESEADKQRNAWNLAQTGTSGKLPGVYQSYMLIRPAPSLRIIFVSPALRKYGKIVQSPFMSHLAAPSSTLAGLKESFAAGSPVTAKVAFMTEMGNNREGTETGRWRRGKSDGGDAKDPEKLGRTCWISATPLLGVDDEVGVWMVVLVDKASVPARTQSKSARDQPVDARPAKSMVADDQEHRAAAPTAFANDTAMEKEPPHTKPVPENGANGILSGVTLQSPPREEAEKHSEEPSSHSRLENGDNAPPKSNSEQAPGISLTDGDSPLNSERKDSEGGGVEAAAAVDVSPEINGHDGDMNDVDEGKKNYEGEPPEHPHEVEEKEKEGGGGGEEEGEGVVDGETTAREDERDTETTPTKSKVAAVLKLDTSGGDGGDGDDQTGVDLIGGELMGVLSLESLRRREKEEAAGGLTMKHEEDSDPDCRIYSPYSVD